ncbi:MAG: hypothetical protein E6I23_08105 [Chloroflexi bacterium]|nr:MAG: hypothetical protein E6I23_08105 [Chloroflexota bacterium]
MQARLETRRFPAAALAFVFALIAVLMLGAAGGYVMSALKAPAVQSVQGPITSTVQGGPSSDLTRVLPQPVAQGGPSSDLTRALPSETVGTSSPCDSLRPHGVC